MHRLIFIFFVVFCSQVVVSQNLVNLSPKDFREQLDKNDTIQLIDVRTSEEFTDGHIEKAINIDFLSEEFKTNIIHLDRDKPVYVYCRSGNRSGKSVVVFKEAGFSQIYNLTGGVLGWEEEGYPLNN